MNPIYELLKNKGLRNAPVLEEMQDHYLSQFEDLTQQGISKKDAYQKVEQAILGLDIQKLNTEYFNLQHKNKLIMLTIISSLFIAFLLMQPTDNPPAFTETAPVTATLASYEPPTISPVNVEELDLSVGFRQMRHPISKAMTMHKGLDIKAAPGTAVVAPSAGVITEAGYHDKKGNYITIEHDETYTTRYYHLSQIDVTIDQEVKIGDKIGEVGSTGASTGPHLHYEVLENGENVDPILFIKA